MKCQSCEAALPTDADFCAMCGTPVRCRVDSCRAVLLKDARACHRCGTRIDVPTQAQEQPLAAVHYGFNHLHVEQGPRHRTLDAHVSDRAVEALSASLSLFVGGQLHRRAQVQRALVDSMENRFAGATFFCLTRICRMRFRTREQSSSPTSQTVRIRSNF